MDLTIGVEEEFFIAGATGAQVCIANAIEEVLGNIASDESHFFVREAYQCMLETRSAPCATIEELRADLVSRRLRASELARDASASLLPLGVFPFEYLSSIRCTQQERFRKFDSRMPWVMPKLCVCGLHIHVGLEDLHSSIIASNVLRFYLPHMLAISAGSPFWKGRPSGLKSVRHKLFSLAPRSGVPPHFDGWKDFEAFEKQVVDCSVVQQPGEIWFHVRPNKKFSTVEVRVFDTQADVQRTVAIADLVRALVAWALENGDKLFPKGAADDFIICHNMWRAARDGLAATFVLEGEQVPGRDACLELLDRLSHLDERLCTAKSLGFIETWVRSRDTMADSLLQKSHSETVQQAAGSILF